MTKEEIKMTVKKFELVRLESDKEFMVFEPDEIVQKISFFETYAYICQPDTDVNLLKKVVEEYQETEDEFEEIAQRYGIKCEIADDSEEYDPDLILVFPDENSDEAICKMSALDPMDVAVYWDGSNLREIWLDIYAIERHTVEIDTDSEVNLDECDGHDRCYKSLFNHGRIYKVVSVDGGAPDQDKKYLLYQFTQWQGSIPKAEFLNAREAARLAK